MKLKLRIFISIIFLSFTASAQWVQKAAFPGTSKAKSTAFTIGNKIYVMGGVTNASAILNDFWEYDIPTNIWSQKPAFPGPERYGATSFVINGKGYIATGGNDFGYLDDLWEYDPTTSMWTQKTGLPAGSAQHENQRVEAYSFVVGNKAYLGGGSGFVFMPNSTGNIAFYDLWEYNPSTNSWVQKSDIPDFIGRNMSIAAAINNKGYVGLGCNVGQTINQNSFWEYDPLMDAWTAKANFPTNYTTDAGAFALNSNLYVVGGVNLNPVGLSNQFYKYDPVTNAWTLLTAFNGNAIAGEFTVATGSTAFAGTGYNGSIVTRSDIWELTVPTGIDENNFQSVGSIKVYPNPATNFITVLSKEKILDVTIYNLLGEKVQSESENYFSVSQLAPGVYTMQIKTANGLGSARFVKE